MSDVKLGETQWTPDEAPPSPCDLYRVFSDQQP